MTDDLPPVSRSPAEALADIARSRKVVRDRVAGGGWRYDLTYAAIAAVMIGGQALDNPFNVSASTLGLLALVLLFQQESRRTGLRVTGMSPRWARWVAVAMGLVAALIIVGVAIIRHRFQEIDVAVVAGVSGAAGFVMVLVGSRVWRRVYRAEMGAAK